MNFMAAAPLGLRIDDRRPITEHEKSSPRLLLIDELSEGLQPSVIDRIGAVPSEERRQHGVSIHFVGRNLDFALSTADRSAILRPDEIDDFGDRGPGVRERVLAHLKI